MSFFIGCGLILKHKQKYVIVQETRLGKAGFYNLPAGTLDVDEDILQCVEREAEEETGVKVAPEYLVGVYQTVMANGNNVLFFVFAAEVTELTEFYSEEHKVIKLLSLDEIAALDAAGEMRAPTVLKSIRDDLDGRRIPLGFIQTYHIDKLAAISVTQGH